MFENCTKVAALGHTSPIKALHSGRGGRRHHFNFAAMSDRRLASIYASVQAALQERRRQQGADAAAGLPGKFSNVDTDVWLLCVFPLLDPTSLLRLLATCTAFSTRFSRDVKDTAAWLFIVNTELPHQIRILDACKDDLRELLSGQTIKMWVKTDDYTQDSDDSDSEVGATPYFTLVGHHDRNRRLETLRNSFITILAPAVPQLQPENMISLPSLRWFTRMVDDTLKDIRVSLMLWNVSDIAIYESADLDAAVKSIHDALIIKVYANQTHITTGENFSRYDQIEHALAQRRAAAEELRLRLSDYSDTLMFHAIVSEVNTGKLTSVEDLIAKRVEEMQQEEPSAVAKGGAATRSARPSKKAKHNTPQTGGGENRAAWARSMLQWLQARSRMRQVGIGGENLVVPRLCPEVKYFDDGSGVVCGKYQVSADGVMEYVCSVKASTNIETSLRNFEKDTLCLRLSCVSLSTTSDSKQHDAIELNLNAGESQKCTFSDDASVTSLGEEEESDTWHIATRLAQAANFRDLMRIRLCKLDT